MNIYAHFEVEIRGIIAALAETGDLPQGLDTSRITCESPRDASHGDLASNAAMVLAKPAGLPPRQLAEKIVEKLQTVDGITGVNIAGQALSTLNSVLIYGRTVSMIFLMLA